MGINKFNVGGFIRINGHSVLEEPMLCKRILAYIPDNQDLYDYLTDVRHNYVMTNQQEMSPVKALFKRDLKRYFTSPSYVFNTLLGYLLMVIAAVLILTTNFFDRLEATLNVMPEPPHKIHLICAALLAILAATSATTGSHSLLKERTGGLCRRFRCFQRRYSPASSR